MSRLPLPFILTLLTCFVVATVSHSSTTDDVYYGGYNITVNSSFYGYQSLVDRDTTGGLEAYDYGAHLMFTGEDTGTRFRAFTGGRWKSSLGDGDHILQWTSPDGTPDSWSMWTNAPEFFQGQETGSPNQWFSGNTMDAEVSLAADGKWIMFVECEIEHGQLIDIPGLTAAAQNAARLILLTSNDNKNWTMKTDRSPVINITQPTITMLHHPEAVYVPWDEDGKIYWLYFHVNVNDVQVATYRIRSNVYDTFDYNNRELVYGFAQLGNQIGYIEDAPGGPLFVRTSIVVHPQSGDFVPSLQFSRDGITWSFGDNSETLLMEGSNEPNNNNCYFVGMSTWLGRGGLLPTTTGWEALYAPTTAKHPIVVENEPNDIFRSEIGLGDFTIEIADYKKANLYCINRTGAATDLHILNRDGNYNNFILQIPTDLSVTNSDWSFELVDFNNDSILDLMCIARVAASNKTEVHILDGATSFQTWLLHKATPLGTTNASWEFVVGDYNADDIPDLYCVAKQTFGGNTEVHVLNGADDFSTWLLQTSTTLHNTNTSWEFELGDYDGDGNLDLYAIFKQQPGFNTEVHVMNGSTNFQSWLLQTSTIIHYTDSNWEFELGDYNEDGVLDLYGIAKIGGSGNVEVHVMNGATSYSSWLLNAAVGQLTADSDWSFAISQ